MTYKLTLLTIAVALTISVTAQTITEEYDYLTKGYKEDVANGKGVKNGYELKHINCLYEGKSYVDVRVFYRLKERTKEKAAYLVVYKNADADSEYFCSPSPKSDTAIINKYWKQLNTKTSLDPLRKKLVSRAVKEIVYWPSYKSDTTERYIIEPIYTITGIIAGVDRSWNTYLFHNLNNTVPTEHGAPNGKYTVNVSYTIDEFGKFSNVVAENNPGYGSAEEAVRVIKLSPSIVPAIKEGKPASFNGNKKITFVLTDGKTPYVQDYIPTKAKDVSLWQKYVHDNFNTAVPYYNGAPSGQYSVIVSFSVDSLGGICDAKAESNPGYGIAEEGIRVISNSPDWIPATKNGIPVSSRTKYTITFDFKK